MSTEGRSGQPLKMLFRNTPFVALKDEEPKMELKETVTPKKVNFWVCRSCSRPCTLLYNDIEPTDGIEECICNGETNPPKWKLEEHEDVLVSELLNHYLPRPEAKQ